MPKKKLSTPVASVLNLPALKTSEGDGQRDEVGRLSMADAYARHMLIAGPLLDSDTAGNPVGVHLWQAVDELSGCERTMDEERDEWAYRIGLMTGLRLAAAVRDERDEVAQAIGGAR